MENQAEQTIEEGVEHVEHTATLFAEPIAHLGPLPITNSLLTSWVTVILIVFFTLALRKNLRSVPGKLQNFFEFILEGALSLTDQVTGNRKISEKVFPLAFSVFLFILVSNWIGLLPLGGLGVIEHSKEGVSFIPFLRSGTADINTTLSLALLSVIGANIFGIISVGAWRALNKYFNFKALSSVFTKIKHDPAVLVVAPVTFFVGVLEFIGEFAKVASLSFRLFGNVFAGEVLLLAMSAIFSFILPIPFLFLEIFVGLIQALIFAILTLVYFTIAATDHDEEH